MTDAAAALRRARELFQQGHAAQAEDIVDGLLAGNPRAATALNFRAYLLYRRGDVDGALAAYRRLTELEPRVAGHFGNLGLLCFKGRRYGEAQEAFERQVELDPGDARALRNLGFSLERQQSLERALDCFTRAGDEESAGKIRSRLDSPARPSVPPRAAVGAGAASRRDDPGRPQAVVESDLDGWLDRRSLAQPGDGPDLASIGGQSLVVQVPGKLFVNTAFCAAHRGSVVFAPAGREAERAASKFGDRHGVLARAEGAGEVVLSGGGRGLHALRLEGGRFFVNHAGLAACGTGVSVSYEFAGFEKGRFLAVELSGTGLVVLGVGGAPAVLPLVPDLPAAVRPEAAVAWTDGLSWEPELGVELKRLAGKGPGLRYRFEGRGHLVLQAW